MNVQQTHQEHLLEARPEELYVRLREEQAVLAALKDRPEVYNLVWFLLSTGLRIGEALALQWDCVDLAQAVITVRRTLVKNNQIQETTKTASGHREVPLPYDLCRAMRLWPSYQSSPFVFINVRAGEPLRQSTFRAMWDGVVGERCGPDGTVVQLNETLTPHVLRHTYCTRCFEAGMDIKEVQYLMGHSTPDVTLRIYTDYCIEARKDKTFETARTARAYL